MNFKIFILLILAFVAGALYVNERFQFDHLEENTAVLRSQNAELRSEVDSLKSEIAKFKSEQDQVAGEMAKKVALKQDELKSLRADLEKLVNGGTRNYSLQDDQAQLKNLREEFKSNERLIRNLESQKTERIHVAQTEAGNENRNQQALKNQMLNALDEKIGVQKQAIEGSQESLSRLKLNRPYDYVEQLQSLETQLANQKGQLGQFERERAQTKATPVLNVKASADTDDVTSQLATLQSRNREVDASISRMVNETKNLASSQTTELKKIQALQAQIRSKENEIKGFQPQAASPPSSFPPSSPAN